MNHAPEERFPIPPTDPPPADDPDQVGDVDTDRADQPGRRVSVHSHRRVHRSVRKRHRSGRRNARRDGRGDRPRRRRHVDWDDPADLREYQRDLEQRVADLTARIHEVHGRLGELET